MHSLMVVGGGLLLLGLFGLFGFLFAQWGGDPRMTGVAITVFIPVWLIIAIINMWVGVACAGYAVRDEAAVFVLVFAIPAVAAAALGWLLARG